MQVEICKILKRDVPEEFENMPVASEVMECLRRKVSPHLMDMINMVLVGFAEVMQREMANHLLNFVPFL
mgnify:CR=1 FL=1